MGKRKIKSKRISVEQVILGPTPEQMARGDYAVQDVTDKRNGTATIAIGKAFRRKPMVDVLADQGMFSDREVKALHHYRHCADTVNRSLVRDSLDRSRYGGTGAGPTAAYLTACRIVWDCEAAAGTLAGILRAVVVDDMSLTHWAIQRAGAVEQCRTRGDKIVCTFEPKRKELDIAKLEIKMAAKRVEAELSA